MAMSIDVRDGELRQEQWQHLRATPEELLRIRAGAPVMRPLNELLGGPSEPATEEEVADLDSWLAEREARHRDESQRLEERIAGLGE